MRCLSIFGLFLALAACQSAPPIVLDSGLEATSALAELRPIDVAVLPIEDASGQKTISPYLKGMRAEVSKALVVQRYSPLALDAVDRGMGSASGSVVDPVFVATLAGRLGANAVLGIRIDRWDAKKLMQNGRIEFSAEVLMIASSSKETLWRGMVHGSIKAGGKGPSPIGESRRFESTAALFAKHLIAELPAREL